MENAYIRDLDSPYDEKDVDIECPERKGLEGRIIFYQKSPTSSQKSPIFET